MDSIKCLNCGLVNVSSDTICERCQSPLRKNVPSYISQKAMNPAHDEQPARTPLKAAKPLISRDIWLALGITVVVLFALIWGVKLRTPKPLPEEAHKALKALQKIRAATEIGVSFNNYHQLVDEAYRDVVSAMTVLPEYPEGSDTRRLDLRNNLMRAIDAYVDAQRVWTEKIGERPLSPDKEPGKTLIPKYGLQTRDPEEALQILWQTGGLATLSVQGTLNSIEDF